MADPMAFEARLSAALSVYADRVPVDADVHAIVRTAAETSRSRPRWATWLRLGAVAALLVLGTLIAYALGHPQTPLGGGGLLLVSENTAGWVLDPSLTIARPIQVALDCSSRLVDGGAQLARTTRFQPVRVQPNVADLSGVYALARTDIPGYGGSNMERWAPDGSRYALGRLGHQDDADPPDGMGAIRVLSIHGVDHPMDSIFEVPGLLSIAWSPDSDQIATVGRVGAGVELAVIDLTNSARRKVAVYESLSEYADLAWTAGGAKIATTIGTAAGGRPALIDLKSGAVVKVPDPDGLLGSLGVPATYWSPDGTRVLGLRENGNGILLDAAGNKVVDVPGDATTDLIGVVDWAPDSRHLIIQVGIHFRLVDANGVDRGLLPVTYGPHDPSLPHVWSPPYAWSPDGSAIAEVTRTSGGTEIAVLNVSTLETIASTTVPGQGGPTVCLQWIQPVR